VGLVEQLHEGPNSVQPSRRSLSSASIKSVSHHGQFPITSSLVGSGRGIRQPQREQKANVHADVDRVLAALAWNSATPYRDSRTPSGPRVDRNPAADGGGDDEIRS